MLDASKEMSRFGSERFLPGALLVNDLPFRMYLNLAPPGQLNTYPPVRHIPEWLPWFSYKPLARFGHDLGNQVLYPPMQFVKDCIVSICVFGCNGISKWLVPALRHGGTLACSRKSSGGRESEIKWI
jgi:hypothetical protein